MKYLRKYALESDWENDQQDREANVPVTSLIVDINEVRYDHEEDGSTIVLTSASNPEVFTILDEAGFAHEDPDGYTAAELGEITDEDFYSSTFDSDGYEVYYSIFYNSNIETFDEFRYFISITEIKHLAFTNCNNLSSITLPSSITDIYGAITHTFFIGAEELTGYFSPFKNTDIASVVIPNSVVSIGSYAFYDCTGLTSITIPNSVTSIGDAIFTSCTNLTSITIGSSVASIQGYIFNGCTALTNITSLATTAPQISNTTFAYSMPIGGTLHVPSGSNYSAWMGTSDYYLGKFNWTIAYDA